MTRASVLHISALLILIFVWEYSCAQWDYSPLSKTDKFLHDQPWMHSTIKPLSKGFISDTLLFQHLRKDTTDLGDFIEITAFGEGAAGYQYMPYDAFSGELAVGAGLQMEAGKRFFLEGRYAYIMTNPLDYVQRFTDSLNVLPGIGYSRYFGNGYDAHYYAGRAQFNINKHFNIEVGNDKHFWGDGYRSLIVSQNAAPYPYAKLTTDVWRVRYVNVWAKMQDISRTNKLRYARNKYVALHALSWNATKKINIGVYEMVVWQARDTLSNRGG